MILTILLLAPMFGLAQNSDYVIRAGDLADTCEATVLSDVKDDRLQTLEGYCIGYIRSYLETYYLLNETETLDPAIGCIPPSTSPRDVARTLVDYLNSAPTARKVLPAMALYIALGKKYPC